MRSAALFIFLLFFIPVTVFAINQGDTAPEFSLSDSTGKSHSLSEYRGRYLYLDFWASWCGPCQLSFPWMTELRGKFPEERLEIVAVNLDKKVEEANKFILRSPPNFKILFDPDGSVPKLYQIKSMPTSVLIDPTGKVVAIHAGFKTSTAEEVLLEMNKLIGEEK